MGTLHLDLEDGFFHDAVTVELEGSTVATVDDATTSVQIGLAEQMTLDVPPDAVLTVHRGDDRLDLLPDPDRPHVGVSVVDSRLVARTSATPFRRA